MSWTPTDSQVEAVAIEMVRRESGEAFINPVQVALHLERAKKIIELVYASVPEVILGLLKSKEG